MMSSTQPPEESEILIGRRNDKTWLIATRHSGSYFCKRYRVGMDRILESDSSRGVTMPRWEIDMPFHSHDIEHWESVTLMARRDERKVDLVCKIIDMDLHKENCESDILFVCRVLLYLERWSVVKEGFASDWARKECPDTWAALVLHGSWRHM
jgi:hypothetical protein